MDKKYRVMGISSRDAYHGTEVETDLIDKVFTEEELRELYHKPNGYYSGYIGMYFFYELKLEEIEC